MVYYGVLSNGCQRCRKRKVKCDQRKPGCAKCQKSKVQCPGYRNLETLIFRDESERIIKKSCTAHDVPKRSQILSISAVSTSAQTAPEDSIPLSSFSISYPLAQPKDQAAASFYFTTYINDELLLSQDYFEWLDRAYHWKDGNYALKAAIEAAGMAGIANVSYAPDIASKSKERYCQALAALGKALTSPTESVADTTLMTAIVLGMYEFITFESWDRYSSWVAHLEGATTLLQLRGKNQFDTSRGGQLYSLLRHQILYTCLQRESPPPHSFAQIGQYFQASSIGETRKNKMPRPMGDMCSRLFSIRSKMKTGKVPDLSDIRISALEMENDLTSWATTLPQNCMFDTVDVSYTSTDKYFQGKRHVYNSGFVAQLWNNWRSLRILISRIILQVDEICGTLEPILSSSRVDLIRKLSADICISAPELIGRPRSAALIWPLSVVAEEPLNFQSERLWAVRNLRHISSSLGIRKASVLANSISASLTGAWNYKAVHLINCV